MQKPSHQTLKCMIQCTAHLNILHLIPDANVMKRNGEHLQCNIIHVSTLVMHNVEDL